ncbi:MAG: hypothetical protein KF773_20330 [Deltaproteobacteria bacterium]|nr:hypothetical protein [Deltaproteobacteria bacterium]MCW5804339.1 hypothetical protein [Deltaproteobacteria bacterium]
MTRICLLLLSAAALSAGCEKSREPSGSGELSSGDKDMFRNLPSGSPIVFGGNYMKVAQFMEQTGLGAVSAKLDSAKGMQAFMTCLGMNDKLKIAGSMAISERTADMRMVMGGIGAGEVEGCAKKIEATYKADGDYLTVEVSDPKSDVAFLKLKDGSLYTRVEGKGGGMGGMGAPKYQALSREDLEADVASAKKGSIADDGKLNDIVAKVDRTQTFWFAGSLAGTPAADKVKEVYGSMDLTDGFGIFVSVQVADPSLADKAEEGIDQVKSMSDALPGELKTLLKELDFKRKGDRIRVSLKLSTEQVGRVVKSLGGLMGGLGGGRRGGGGF